VKACTSATLHNLNKHPANRTRVYKAELRVKSGKIQGLEHFAKEVGIEPASCMNPAVAAPFQAPGSSRANCVAIQSTASYYLQQQVDPRDRAKKHLSITKRLSRDPYLVEKFPEDISDEEPECFHLI